MKNIKRIRKIGVMICLLTVLLCFVCAHAEETTIIASGECGDQGDNVTWTLDSAGKLVISGTGRMDDEGAPWHGR